jgi:hypothetical protein
MKNIDGTEMSDKEIMKVALDHIADAACFLFEINSDEGIAAAFMCDTLLHYVSAIYKDRDPRLSEDDYNDLNEDKDLLGIDLGED